MADKVKFMSAGSSVDGTTYCSGVDGFVENVMEDDETDATIVYPSKDGWCGVRSSDFKMDTNNAEVLLPYPIYKIKKVMLKPPKLTVYGLKAESQNYELPHLVTATDFKDSEGVPFSSLFDITRFFVTEEEWTSLPTLSKVVGEGADRHCTLGKDNTFYWKQGENKIVCSGEVFRKGVWLFADASPAWKGLIGSFLVELEQKAREKLYVCKINKGDTLSYGKTAECDQLCYIAENSTLSDEETKTWTDPETGKKISFEQGEDHDGYFLSKVSASLTVGVDVDTTEDYLAAEYRYGEDIRRWQFRIEYVPMLPKFKIRARKAEKQDVEYLQPFNQRAELNAASAFGKNMYLTAQKTGVRTITLTKNYTKLKDIPPLGAVVRHDGKLYRLIANKYLQTNTKIMQVMHTLSENWSNRSQHVAVDQKYRNWKIPQDTLWRMLHWEDYLRVAASPLPKGNAGGIEIDTVMRLFNRETTEDQTITTMAWYYKDGDSGVVVPCSTMGIANSMIFSASFKDSLSAGMKMDEEKENYCQEAWYCNEDGTLKTATVLLTDKLHTGTWKDKVFTESTDPNDDVSKKAREIYPEFRKTAEASYNDPDSIGIFRKEFYIDKQPGEALRFTYQIHLVGEDQCFFGNKFAEHNPLVRDWNGQKREFRLWLCQNYVRIGADVYEEDENNDVYMGVYDFSAVVEHGIDGDANYYFGYLDVKLPDYAEEQDYKAWVITDENNNIYVGCNDISVRKVYIQLLHKR